MGFGAPTVTTNGLGTDCCAGVPGLILAQGCFPIPILPCLSNCPMQEIQQNPQRGFGFRLCYAKKAYRSTSRRCSAYRQDPGPLSTPTVGLCIRASIVVAYLPGQRDRPNGGTMRTTTTTQDEKRKQQQQPKI